MLPLRARDLGPELVELDRWRQLSKTEERLERQLVRRLCLPEEGFRGYRSPGQIAEPRVVTSQEFALRWMRLAVRRGERRFFSVLCGCPVGMAGLAVHVRQRRVDPVQVRQLLQRLVIEEECAPILPPLHPRVRDERGDKRRCRI